MISNTDTATLLQKAILHHQNGQLDTAESIYLTLLESFPNHVTLLTNLGTITFNRDKLEQSLEISFYQPVALNSRGNTLISQFFVWLLFYPFYFINQTITVPIKNDARLQIKEIIIDFL